MAIAASDQASGSPPATALSLDHVLPAAEGAWRTGEHRLRLLEVHTSARGAHAGGEHALDQGADSTSDQPFPLPEARRTDATESWKTFPDNAYWSVELK